MKILYTPLMIVPSLSAEQRAGILEAAGPGTVLVEAKEPARQRAEIVDTDILFGRVAPDIFVLNRRLRFYHSIGAGVDAVLSPELVQSDIPLASEKGGVGIHLAEHAFALLLGLTRGLHTAIRRPDYGLREPIRLEQRELLRIDDGHRGLRWGGPRGRAARARLRDARDRRRRRGRAARAGGPRHLEADRLYEMLGLADVVVIGLPLTKATRHLFTRDLFRRMRRTAILINVTRGEIIYGEDLLAALDEGLIWGAGLDVTDPEPLAKDHRLWTHPRVIVTPHTAGGSPRRAQRVIDTFCENLRRMRAGQPFIALIDKDKGY